MTYKYYSSQDGIYHMEIEIESGSIGMCLDPNDSEHSQIINAIGISEEKALKYATYLSNGGCNYFDLTEILKTINT
jgi:hypothetical protein